MRKFFDYSDASSRASFAARFDALPDPLAKVESAFRQIETLAKVLRSQQDEINRLTGRNAEASRRYADNLAKLAATHVEAYRRNESGLMKIATGPQPPFVYGPSGTYARAQASKDFLTHFRSH